MRFSHITLLLAALLAMPACKKEPAPAPAQVNPDAPKNGTVTTTETGLRVYTTPVSDEELKRREQLAEKRAGDGKILPPRSQLSIRPLRVAGRMHEDDVATSFEFVRGGFEFCHINSMGENEELSGKVVLDMKRGSDAPTVTAFRSEIDVPGFEDCIRRAAAKWLLPGDSEFSAEIQFTAKPALTTADIRARNQREGNREHNHGAHGAAPDAHGAAPDAPQAAPDAHGAAPDAHGAAPDAQ